MPRKLSRILANAIRENPRAKIIQRSNRLHGDECRCSGCTPVLKELMWFGHTEPQPHDSVPESCRCKWCGEPLELACRGVFELIGHYSHVTKWYFRCNCATAEINRQNTAQEEGSSGNL